MTSTCTTAREVKAADLFGNWTLEITKATLQTTRFTLKQNPEFADSLAGEYTLDGLRHEVFGDVEDGEIEWEETTNGKDPSALWKGRIQEGSCGKTIVGTRQSVTLGEKETRGQPQAFVLRRSGW